MVDICIGSRKRKMYIQPKNIFRNVFVYKNIYHPLSSIWSIIYYLIIHMNPGVSCKKNKQNTFSKPGPSILLARGQINLADLLSANTEAHEILSKVSAKASRFWSRSTWKLERVGRYEAKNPGSLTFHESSWLFKVLL